MYSKGCLAISGLAVNAFDAKGKTELSCVRKCFSSMFHGVGIQAFKGGTHEEKQC